MNSHLKMIRLGQYLTRRTREFLKDDRGQSTTEYILILSVVVMIAMKFKQEFQGRLTKVVQKLGSDIEDATNNE